MTKSDYPLAVEEWDFHEVEDWEVEWVIRHEYARQCPEQMEWLAQVIKPDWYRHFVGVGLARERGMKSQDKNEMAKWEKQWGKFYREVEILIFVLKNGVSPDLVIAMETAVRLGLDYRESWLKQRQEILPKVRRWQRCIDELPLVRLEPWPPRYTGGLADVCLMAVESSPDYKLASWSRDPKVSRYALHVDWNLVNARADGKRKLIACLSAALEKARPEPRPKGRDAAARFHLLRALAAWRWKVKAGCAHRAASKHIRRRELELGLNQRKKLGGFPAIADPGAWSKSIAKSEAHIHLLQGEPNSV